MMTKLTETAVTKKRKKNRCGESIAAVCSLITGIIFIIVALVFTAIIKWGVRVYFNDAMQNGWVNLVVSIIAFTIGCILTVIGLMGLACIIAAITRNDKDQKISD